MSHRSTHYWLWFLLFGVIAGLLYYNSHRGLDAGFSEPFAEPDGRVLRPSIRMVDNIFEVELTFALAGPATTGWHP